MAADVGTGLTIQLVTTGKTFQLLDVNFGGVTRENIDISYQGSTPARAMKPVDLYDAGTLEAEVNLEGFTGEDAVESLMVAPEEVINVFFPLLPTGGFNGQLCTVTGFLINFAPSNPLEAKQTATLTWKLTGAQAWLDHDP